ncbi:hypothetical protein [Spirillospora sp. CA-128828]|uniref:hypothetical protein n=1 Tax=Spirillospora sp. CA-128828 TaxID=3240033 RepID=UPI003D93E9DE
MTIQPTNENQPAAPARPSVALARPVADLDQAWRLAQALAGSSILPNDLRGKAGNVLVILMYGQELGLSPMQSIQGIYVVNGRPQMSGQLWLAKVREAGHSVKVSDHTEKSCTVTITRGDTGEEHSETFTWADAERAKLAKKDIWLSYPKRMLMWRAVSHCATTICPEVAMGFGAEVPEAEAPAPEVALAHAVDARTAEPAPADDGEVHDAEVIGEPSGEDLAKADEEARQEVLGIAAEHEGQGDPLAYSADEIAEMS